MALNEKLYRSLFKAFHGGVKIAKENEPMQCTPNINPITGKKGVKLNSSGEEYRVCCPFCDDERYRLWINHRWDTQVDDVKFGLGLMNCFNDGCDLNMDHADPEDRRLLQTQFKDMLSPLLRHTLPSRVATPVEKEKVEPALPETIMSLGALPTTHAARQYLDRRGYMVEHAIETWNLLYCPDDNHPFVRDRIILPITMEGKLRGWQARYVGEPEDPEPKYYTMPGTQKNSILYNYDRASKFPWGVLVEGVTDVWSVGFQGVCRFGSTLSAHQLNLLTLAWHESGVILLADGDVKTTEAKAKTHATVLETLKHPGNFKKGVVEVLLPEGADPGKLSAYQIWSRINDEAHRQLGIEGLHNADALKGVSKKAIWVQSQ